MQWWKEIYSFLALFLQWTYILHIFGSSRRSREDYLLREPEPAFMSDVILLFQPKYVIYIVFNLCQFNPTSILFL